MPRCHNCGAASGASFTTWSNPLTDSVIRPARKSSIARSRISRALGARCASTVTANTIALLTTKIEAEKRVLIANVEETVGQGRIGSQHAVQNLRARDRL